MRLFFLDKLFLFRAGRYAILLSIVLLSGCQTTSPKNLFEVSSSHWKTSTGQALWRPEQGMPEFGGDLVMGRRADGCCFIEFEKTPMPILSAQTTPNAWLIRFGQRNMEFSGHAPAPARFAWLYLPRALAGEQLPAFLHFERKKSGAWRLENPGTGETLEGFLSQ